MSLTPRAVLTTVIRRVKNDPSYEIHRGIRLSELAREFVGRGSALARAQVKLLGISGSALRFVEPGVVIQHRRHLSVGRGSVLERGALLRCLSVSGVRIGSHVTIGRHSIIEGTGVLWHLAEGFEIGNNSSLGDWSFVGCGGGVRIGQRVIMGQRVSMHSQNHNFSDLDTPIQQQGVRGQGIVIEDDCWIGSGAILLDGVTVGTGSIVAAGSIVTRSCPPGSVIAGNPARIVRHRDEGSQGGARAAS